MTMTELMLSQAADPFRIGLMAALVFTTLRQRAATGLMLPLALGAGFFAILLPTVMGGVPDLPVVTQVIAGLAVNVAWLAVIMGGWMLVRRLRG